MPRESDHRVLAAFFAFIEGQPAIERVDAVQSELVVRASDGRLVRVEVDARILAAAVRDAAADGSLRGLSGSSDLHRFFGLFLVHMDEGINSLGAARFERFRYDRFGVRPAG